ncbi:MAG TPA: metallophosphoesterase family protein [Pseudogracilibacillus sp.]|nr:metallophosphoesterase family protein [Pseudogracilibacillus sp.]
MNPNKFLHIADLHLIENLHVKTVEENLHHFTMKKQVFNHITNLIKKEEIGAILIAGDIEAEAPEKIYPFFKDWLDLDVRIFIVFGDHDTALMRKELKELFQDEANVYMLEDGEMIQDASLNFNVYGLNCEPKQTGFLTDFKNLPVKSSEQPTVFLTHPYQLPKTKMRELGCEYFATGHIHHFLIEKIDENIKLGRPGHIYSYWDGDGKAWPTGGIIGEFNGNNLTLGQTLFPVPQTLRFSESI